MSLNVGVSCCTRDYVVFLNSRFRDGLPNFISTQVLINHDYDGLHSYLFGPVFFHKWHRAFGMAASLVHSPGVEALR